MCSNDTESISLSQNKGIGNSRFIFGQNLENFCVPTSPNWIRFLGRTRVAGVRWVAQSRTLVELVLEAPGCDHCDATLPLLTLPAHPVTEFPSCLPSMEKPGRKTLGDS